MRSCILDLSRKLRQGELTARELAETYLERIAASSLNAYAHVTFDEAIADAEYADRLLAKGEGTLLTGIPMALKDNISTKGLPTTCCSRILEGYRPFYDATVWEKLKRQGAVLLGKNTMDEFAMGSTSETSALGIPLNPHDLSRVAGGSSGGSACAVAADLAVYALGSDTGGSVRQPASFCGVVGLKPSYGAVSRYGLVAYASSFDQIGPLTAGVQDAAIVFDAIRGFDPHDLTSVSSAGGIKLERGVSDLTIGVVEELISEADEPVREAVERAIARYREEAKVVRLSLPKLSHALPAYYIIACAEASSNLGRYDGIRYGKRAERYDSVDDMICRTRSEGFGKEVKRRIMLGTFALSAGYYDAYYQRACAVREEIRSVFSDAFTRCDVLLTPATPQTAFPLGYMQEDRIRTYRADLSSVLASVAGLPAISLPCGRDKDGLPVGLQIIGRRLEEETILRAAYWYERNGEEKEAEDV